MTSFPPFQLSIAYLGALGSGALRSLDRFSAWLLPLGVANFERLRAAGGASTFLALFPPPTLTVPSLSLAALLAIAARTIGMAELFWPLLVATSPNLRPVLVALAQLTRQSATDAPALAAAVWRYAMPGPGCC